jgi:hypothetical protein
VPDVGPRGRYRYYFETVVRGNVSMRQYRQVLANAHISEESYAESPSSLSELVVELNVFTSDLQAISLSADESMVALVLNAFLVGADGTPELEVWVRHIETGRQIEIETNAASAVTVVEFGPQLVDCALHTLTCVTTGKVGRPCTAHVVTVNPTTLICSKSQIMYHSDDPVVHVDVQRCKGCRYLAVHARTQWKHIPS